MAHRLSASCAAFALCCGAPALAATGGTTRAETPESGWEVVCRVQSTLGSRLGAKKVCLTRDQWRQQRQDSRDESERAQRTRYSNFRDPDTR